MYDDAMQSYNYYYTMAAEPRRVFEQYEGVYNAYAEEAEAA